MLNILKALRQEYPGVNFWINEKGILFADRIVSCRRYWYLSVMFPGARLDAMVEWFFLAVTEESKEGCFFVCDFVDFMESAGWQEKSLSSLNPTEAEALSKARKILDKGGARRVDKHPQA